MKINGDISDDEIAELIRNNNLTPDKFFKAYIEVHGIPKAFSATLVASDYVSRQANKFWVNLRKGGTKIPKGEYKLGTHKINLIP